MREGCGAGQIVLVVSTSLPRCSVVRSCIFLSLKVGRPEKHRRKGILMVVFHIRHQQRIPGYPIVVVTHPKDGGNKTASNGTPMKRTTCDVSSRPRRTNEIKRARYESAAQSHRERGPRTDEYLPVSPVRGRKRSLEREPDAASIAPSLRPGAHRQWRPASHPNSCPSSSL